MQAAWHGWYPLGGGNLLVSAGKEEIAVTYPNASLVDLYMRGANDDLFQKWWDCTNWIPPDDGWAIHPDSFKLGSAPTVVSLGVNHRDVYVRGQNGGVFHKYWDGKQWNGWYNLGGTIKGRVGVVNPTPNTIDLYVRGTNDELYQKWWDGSKWTPPDYTWIPFNDGFKFDSSPVVYSRDANHRDIYVRGMDGSVYHKYWDGVKQTWNGWYNLGGTIKGDVGVVYPTPNTIDLYVRGMNDELYQKWWDGKQWTPPDYSWIPHNDGFKLGSSPVVYSLGGDHRDIYARGQDGLIYHKHWTPDHRFGTANMRVGFASGAVDALFAPKVNQTTPGAAVIVIKNGQVVHAAGYGLADTQSKQPITPKTKFHLCSCAKQQTALGIMMLKHDNIIDYNDPVGKHLPEVARFGNAFTIRTLLHHTSGMPDYYGGAGRTNLFAISGAPTNNDVMKLLSTWGTLKFTPNTFEVYSNEGYDLLACLIERKSGLSYSSFMQKRVFDYLGMPDSFSLPDPQRLSEPHRAIGHTKETNGSFTALGADAMDNITGSGSIFISVLDFHPYVRALRTDQLVPQTMYANDAYVSRKLTNGSAGPDGPYGFGWALGSYKGTRHINHAGIWAGYCSRFSTFPDRNLYIIALSNRDDLDADLSNIVLGIADIYW
jgi:CubicO group peptidase (beta-lactamase class C family)